MVKKRREGEYRKIKFELTEKNIWLMIDRLPGESLRWGYWCRFFSDDEIKQLDIPDKTSEDIDKDIEILKKGIDRAYRCQPCYTGDIRFRNT